MGKKKTELTHDNTSGMSFIGERDWGPFWALSWESTGKGIEQSDTNFH